VFERVKNEFDVSVLCNLVLQIVASHVFDDSDEWFTHYTQHNEVVCSVSYVVVVLWLCGLRC
jgi:hypothetical protein